MEYLSTTSLAREMDVPASELFSKLKGLGLIDRHGDKWVLTDAGRRKGGQTRATPKHGEFIVWPEDISFEESNSKAKHLNATALGRRFGLSSQRMNLVLAELGWMEKNVAGWSLTKIGRSVGARQLEHESGSTYVVWPVAIAENKRLLDVVNPQAQVAPAMNEVVEPKPGGASTGNGFRDKYEAKQRTIDGHYVRSRAEMLIDNWLYHNGIVHAYERRLPIEEECYCDFYIPQGAGRPQAVYIEYWGMEDKPDYVARKKTKLETYRRNEIPLIELVDADINNLDDVLPKKLLQFKIKVG